MPTGPEEAARLQRLQSLALLDTGPEPVLDAITEAVARATGLPVALISLVDRDRQWFKSAVGLPQGAQTPRAGSFCQHAIQSGGFFEVEDARRDQRFIGNPQLEGDAPVIHYAGMPLIMPGGERIGVLCVIGHVPGRLPPQQCTLLQDLARSTVQVLLLREGEAQVKRQQALARAADMAALSPVGLFSADTRGRLVQVNPGLLRLLGLPPLAGDAPPPDWLEAVHPSDRPALVQDWQRAVERGETFERDFRTRPLDGRVRWLRLRFTPTADAAGPAAFVGAVNDITERHASETRLSLAVEATGLRLWELSPQQGELELPRDWAQRVVPGWREPLLPAERVRAAMDPAEADQLRGALDELLAGRSPQLMVEHRLFLDGAEPAWVETQGRVVERDEEGNALRVIGTTRDISERKRREAALQQALEQARAASQAKLEFLATMSHEIRTPLNGVIGIVRMLREAPLPLREAGYVALLESCANSLLTLVSKVLDHSRIEAGELQLAPATTDLHALLRETGDVFELRAREKQLRFELRIEPGVPRWVVLDPQRLRQILLNLMGNALKFTAYGGFGLRVDAAAGASEAPMLALSVWDSGMGISPADQDRLFRRFSQAAVPGQPQAQGSGLGLAISRELARLMGGELTVRSQPGQGASFVLELPLVEAGGGAGEADAEGPPALPAGARVLLVEDNPINQMVAESLLQRLGVAEVALANDGQEALAHCAAGDFDLLLMDCQMPVMDGLEATRRLRAQGWRGPIVALTAGGMTRDRDACLAAGMDDYLPKPIDERVLGPMLARWLGGKG